MHKCDRDRPIFSAERGVLRYKIGPNWIENPPKAPKQVVITAEPPYHAQV